MTHSRRKILMFGGATAAITVAGGWGALATPSLSKAVAPWMAAGKGFGDPRLDALSYAILAPNPHNRQPWQFTLAGEDRIDITCDLDKRLPSTDPFDRQIVIGFGCMIELLRQAAAQLGFSAQIEAFPDGEGQPRLDERPIARVRLVADKPPVDALFGQILNRRSTKEPYLDRSIEEDKIKALSNVATERVRFGQTGDADQVAVIGDNAFRAWLIEQDTAATRRESIELMRFGNDEVVAQPDGIDMGGTFLSAMNAAGIVTPETLDTPGSTAYQSGVDMYRGMVESTRHWVWLTTDGNRRSEQLEAGASWVRLNQVAQANGLAVHPWSHALQEFPEMAGPYRELQDLIAPDGGTVQMFARLGYGPSVPASPRWPLEAKLIDG